ncbi:hypothetical protein ACLMAL_06100 [Nocardia sp. CWNU-33]
MPGRTSFYAAWRAVRRPLRGYLRTVRDHGRVYDTIVSPPT